MLEEVREGVEWDGEVWILEKQGWEQPGRTAQEPHGGGDGWWFICRLWVTFLLVLCSFAVCFNNPSNCSVGFIFLPKQSCCFHNKGQYCSLCFLFPLCDGVTMVINIYCVSSSCALGLFFSKELSRSACEVPGSVRQ